ncbi:hypothetical protein [Dickeya oryzae]|uniref:hypothetical protein n=1 Tax=Dickeya oryzae TaxID=1240404 RepID=UPI001AEC83DB|nr:hypothetical protein [Dickeya oryzae]
MELMSFISDVNFMTLWEHKTINYTNENEKDYVLFLDRLVVEMDKQNEVLSGVGFSLNHSYKIKLLQAIEILSQSDVVLGYALRNFIGRILIVNCDSLVASSSILYLGLVIISPKDDWTIFDYMENLIHEMSHIELYIKQLVDPLVLSGTTLKSPFRIYPPLSG